MIWILFPLSALWCQQEIHIHAELNDPEKKIHVRQTLLFTNTSSQILDKIILNDWNHAYASKNSPLAKRFSDEFNIGFHLAKSEERGSTETITLFDEDQLHLSFQRLKRQPDIIEVRLRKPLKPGEQITLYMTYSVKIPKDRFTRYGYNDNGAFSLRNWWLVPARLNKNGFVTYSNLNLDDSANEVADYTLKLKASKFLTVQSDLDLIETKEEPLLKTHTFKGDARTVFALEIEPEITFESYRNSFIEVSSNLKDQRLTDIQKAIVVDRVANYVQEQLGEYPHKKVLITQSDYEKNPFYGLNQLPSFISPFPDQFLFEIKFLKTYLNAFLKNSLHLDPRKDNWIFDGIQIYTMMKYIDLYHPEAKMMGNLSYIGILRGYKLMNVSFNEQYSYYYMLMARRNLDQPIGDSKDTFIKFNEQIAGKYRSGLSFSYLESYFQSPVVSHTFKTFLQEYQNKKTTSENFEISLREAIPENIDWFFDTIINSREIIDYTFSKARKENDSIWLTLKNRTGTTVPIPVYGLKNNEIVFKKWFRKIDTDTTWVIPKNGIDKVVINYENEVPEFNLRNNWKSLKSLSFTNRPFKLNFMKDLEDPFYNQILFVPTVTYNYYDGISPGLRFHNKTILNKPITYDINPIYSPNTQSLIGNFTFTVNQFNRNSRLHSIRYLIPGSYFHYAPQAGYFRFNPSVIMSIRQNNFRDNHRQLIYIRNILINRQKSPYVTDHTTENYNVFNLRYLNTYTEMTRHFSYSGDFQSANSFGKFSAEVEFRKLFENNRQLNIRFFAGTFLYRNTQSDYFSFALDRPTDYLFDYNLYGRSEATGFFSQQFIMSEGGFKSKLDTPYANQWLSTLNSSINIWNWIEVYGDMGMVKNRQVNPEFVFDTGIRLNLVTDYFELYFPIYSSNGWEAGQPNYNERIRFMITLNPNTLTRLFTRKWF